MSKRAVKTNAILNIVKQCSNIIFPLITYPYVVRVIGTKALGRYSFADSIIQYAIILATLGISGYAIREGARVRDDQRKINQFSKEIFTINIISLLLSCVLLVILIIFIKRIRKEEIIIAILSINMISAVLGRDWINSIYEDYLFITLRYVVFQAIAIVFMFIFVKSPDDIYNYTIVVVIGNSGAQIANIIRTCRIVPIKICLSRNLKKHLKPIIFMFCISVASIIYINSDITILGFLCDDDEVGTYYMTAKIYTIIKTLMNAIITVSIPRLSYYLGNDDKENYNNLLISLKKYLYMLLIPSIVGLFMLSDNLLYIVGGEELEKGILSLEILCFAMFFAVFGSYYAHAILIPNRRESVFFKATIISAIINILLNFVFIPAIGIYGAALTTLLSEVIVVWICSYNSKKLYRGGENNILFSVFIGSIMIIGICAIIKTINLNIWIETILSIIISVIAYFICMLVLKNELAISIIRKIKK